MHLFTRDLFMLTLSLFLIKNVTKKVVLSRAQRNKKKYVTVVTGLGTFGKWKLYYKNLFKNLFIF